MFALVLAWPDGAQAGPGSVNLAPHRAVYDMTLTPNGEGNSAVIGKGRMVYEIQGAPCSGFSVSMRWVAQQDNGTGGNMIEDLRYASWEDGEGQDFTFNSKRYRERSLIEEMDASASKGDGETAGRIVLRKPEPKSAPLPSDTIYPTEHVRLVISDAIAGKAVRTDKVYDVSDDGTSIYDTFTLISPLSESQKSTAADVVPELDGMQAWSASISYFLDHENDAGEAVPAYEQTFALFANGVSSTMRLGTESVIIDAILTQVDFLPLPDC